MGKNSFQEYICRPYCFFFKDGEKEEMTCRGAEVLDSLVKSKQIDIMTIPPLIKQPGLWKKHKETLGVYLCSHCYFRAEDCDFQSEAPSDDMEPCGGFILIAHLRANGLIQESDLE
jgi:hypothetical protein